jgi:hypothetical protein
MQAVIQENAEMQLAILRHLPAVMVRLYKRDCIRAFYGLDD